MRTGADYREALRDGRKVWVMNEGWAEDVTSHSAARAMVEEYALWYDRHFDPAWRDILLAPPAADVLLTIAERAAEVGIEPIPMQEINEK